MSKNSHAIALGKLGGSVKSESKTLSARLNGKLGGRPRSRAEAFIESSEVFQLTEMARVYPEDSGVPLMIVILVGEGLPHGPRIKVSTLPGKVSPDSLVQVTVSDHPEFIGKLSSSLDQKTKNKIVAFIQKNKEVLQNHYYGKLTDKQALNTIQAV